MYILKKSCKRSYLPNNLTSLYKFGDKESCSKSKVNFLIVKKMKIQIFLFFLPDVFVSLYLTVKIIKNQIFLYNSFLTKSNLHFKIILLLIKQLNDFSGNSFGLRKWQHCRNKFILSSVTVIL